nr:LicD family protein [Lactococcus fujiensis]
MKELTDQELKQLQLEMTAYIDQICRENEIEYSLGGGSLLGSIRHKGYIPWDDDIDLMLIRPNYERLMSLLTEKLPEHYSIIYYKVRPTYLPFAKSMIIGLILQVNWII